MCKFCNSHLSKGVEIGEDYPIKPCANGDLKVRAKYMDGGIVLFRNLHTASGYFDINFCPICGRKIDKNDEQSNEDILTLTLEEEHIDQKPHSRYRASCFIPEDKFRKVIRCFDGTVYDASHTGRIGNVLIYNGGLFICIDLAESFEENDEWARKFEEAYNSLSFK